VIPYSPTSTFAEFQGQKEMSAEMNVMAGRTADTGRSGSPRYLCSSIDPPKLFILAHLRLRYEQEIVHDHQHGQTP
jgi:hypothetical protein